MLLVHGSATSGRDWLFVLPSLRERFTVVTMDRRGRGQSGDGSDYAMEREAEDVLAVLDAVDAEILIGHSYGALCAMRAAERTDRLRRLVLYEPPIALKEGWPPGVDEAVAGGDLEAALASFLLGAGVPVEQFEAIRSSPAWPVLLDAVPPLPRELHAGAAWRAPLTPIGIPTLFLVGAESDGGVYLEGLAELEAAFPNARRESIPGQRHLAHVFAPEAFVELVSGFCAEPL